MYHTVSINSWCKFFLFYFILHCVHHWHLLILLHICTVSTTDCSFILLYLALCKHRLLFIVLYLHCVLHLLLLIHTVSCNVSTLTALYPPLSCTESTTDCCSSILYLAMCPPLAALYPTVSCTCSITACY